MPEKNRLTISRKRGCRIGLWPPPLLSDDDLVHRLEHAEGVLFDAIAYEC